MELSYWKRQTPTKPLFADIEWSKPERRDMAGRLGIIGGNKLGFAGVAEAYSVALSAGVGQVRVLLPDVLKSTVPRTITDTVYAPSTPSGSLSRDGTGEMQALASYTQGILLAGDAGRNAETALAYEQFITDYQGLLTITRDSIDLVKNSSHLLVDRPQTLIVASFAQIQKLLQAIYYPKVMTFSLPLMQVVEIMHKFTITYPCTVAMLHRDHMIIAHDGQVVTQEWGAPLRIWRGETAARMASYWLWSPDRPLEAASASIANT